MKKSNINLTASQLQVLHDIVKLEVRVAEAHVKTIKGVVNYYWERSDKKDPSSQSYFEDLNRCKDSLREMKATVVMLANISYNIKKDKKHAS